MVWIPTIPKHWGLLVGLPHWSLNSIEPLEIDNRLALYVAKYHQFYGAMLLAKGFVAGYLLTCAILIVISFFPNRCAVDKTGIHNISGNFGYYIQFFFGFIMFYL